MEEQSNSFSVPQERIKVIDALRGFTLLGVLIAHMLQRYSVPNNLPRLEPLFPDLDASIQLFVRNFVSGKFVIIFSFLFGLSFFIQMDRASKKGMDFRKRFLWRMAVLLVIGMVGNCFYSMDILPIYAILGFIMVLFYNFKNWMLIVFASLLLLGAPRFISTVYNKVTLTEQIVEQQQPSNRDTPRVASTSTSTQNVEPQSFFEAAYYNVTTQFARKWNMQFGPSARGWVTFALFLLGIIVGRSRFFEQVHLRKKQNIILFAGFVISAIIMNYIISLFPQQGARITSTTIWDISLLPRLSSMALSDIRNLLYSGSYVMGFIVLFQIKHIGKGLDILTPYGRMGLTNYEMQSILGAIIFSMWGLGAIFGNQGPTQLLILALVIYTIQVIISKYWMKYFIYGPFEWFWRSATYMKWQPFKKNNS